MSIASEIEKTLDSLPIDWRTETARALAKSLDYEPNASMARELRSLMAAIIDSIPAEETTTADDLRKRRARRIADAATS